MRYALRRVGDTDTDTGRGQTMAATTNTLQQLLDQG